MHYRLTNTTSIIRVADGACIPADPDNTDYQRFLREQAEGAVVEPYVPPSAKPEVMTELKARREEIFKPLDRMQMRALSTEDQLRIDVENCKQALRDLPTLVDPLLTDDMSREQMEDVALAQYKALAAATPAHIRSAFKVLA